MILTCESCSGTFSRPNKQVRSGRQFCSRGCCHAGFSIPIERRLEDRSMPIPFCGCIVWLGYINEKGYGIVKYKGRMRPVHRVSWELANNCTIPDDLETDHLCRVRCCINPNHLEPVTRSINQLRGNISAVHKANALARTTCPNGHPYDQSNTRISVYGWRQCKQCHRVQNRESSRRIRTIT